VATGTPTPTVQRHTLHGAELELLRCGGGRPIVLLHGMQHLDPQAPFIKGLARHGEVIGPSHPGFGRSSRPDGFETTDDLVRLYLSFLDQIGAEKVTLVGFSFGGWIAAELATLCSHRLDRLVLVDAFGIKVSDRETPDILDVFNTHPDEVLKRTWCDPARYAPDFDAMTDEELTIHARNWDSLCLYGWQPYMHNPRLKRWLTRINVPTLVAWGANDGIVKPSYGRAYCDLIPEAQFTLIDNAGHRPEIEQPDVFTERVRAFLDAG
jgi:pimeloyl-ACP methyl ester carboxylesterase